MVVADVGYRSRPDYVVSIASEHSLAGIVTCLLIALLVSFSIYRQTPPAAVSANAPPLEFSSGRAMHQLAAIAQKPHPIGSFEHSAVRDYIVNELTTQGLKPEVQTTTAVNSEENGHIRAGTVENIVAQLPGTANTGAVLLVGHYDSVSNGPGASDDGAAVVAMLETLRALKAAAPLKNDVIFLFTDGEEAGQLGAYGFVAEHPLAKDVGLVLNFEARGNTGPVIMFETSPRNGWLISEFAKAIPYPVSHSLAYEIYRLLPNDTDFTVFKKARMSGLNFAFIKGLTRYHTPLDNLSEIDERSLQHEGSTLLALTRHFGDLTLRDPKETNAVYFDVVGLGLIHYSSVLVLPLTIAIVLLFAGLIIIGLRKRRLTVSGIALGFLAFLSSLVAASVLVTLVWSLILRSQDVPGVRQQGEAYNYNLYLLGFIAVTIAITSLIYILFRKRVSSENLTVGGLISWVILLVLSTIYVPGASYLMTVPLLFILPALAYMLVIKDSHVNTLKPLLLFSIGSAVGILLWAPTIYQTSIGLTLRAIGIVMAMVVLLLVLLIPHFKIIAASREWLLPGASILAGFTFILVAGLTSYAPKTPRLDTILYGLNADTQTAMWASSDRKADAWTTQFLSGDVKKGPLTDFFSKGSVRQFLQSSAPSTSLSAPNITLLADSTQDGVRTLRLHVTSSRQATTMSIFLDSEAVVLRGSVNGKLIDNQSASSSSNDRNQWDLRYYALPQEGIEIVMEIKSTQPLKLRAVDQTYGFPEALAQKWTARPDTTIAAPLPYNDSTFVSKSFIF
jgi:hypothetical protein